MMFEPYKNWENPHKIKRGGSAGRGSSYLVWIQDSEFSRNFGPRPWDLVEVGRDHHVPESLHQFSHCHSRGMGNESLQMASDNHCYI